ncbi:MAG: S46 family peptidase [Candidatus Cryptobacteroides sp.]|nr:S46 family peptidase [Candidatus Cryptobacteroides sp.]
MKITKYLMTAVALIIGATAFADEGMWMIQDINEALEKNMRARGLKLAANEIYNDEAPGTAVSDAVVSIGFYCTGSVISDQGLIITNHHCAYSNIAKLSTPEHNYLEDGFWAMTSEEEIPIEGETVFFLKKVFDVTEEVKGIMKEFRANGKPFGIRKISAIMEKRYKEATGMECILSSMWAGEKYYMSVYKTYTDLRLVAAPPQSIGYFGGNQDNWTWPRHNCDFTIYRIYEDGKPVTREKSLKVSLAGYHPGSFAMVIGYPGRTNRYTSSAEINYQEKINLPISNAIRGGQMSIIRKWMDADPTVRMKYSEWFFSLSNIQENNDGMAKCFRRFWVKDEKIEQEKEMQKWIDAAPNRKAMWETLIPDLKAIYSETESVERDKVFFRETMFRGTFISRYMLRAGNVSSVERAKETLREGFAATDARVEKELLEYACKEYFENLEFSYFGKFQVKMLDRFGDDYKAMAEYIWNKSVISSLSRIDGIQSVDEVKNDPLRRMLTDTPVTTFNNRKDQLEKRQRVNKLGKEYKKALYWMRLHKDVEQYPDANSTMRITYGTVGGLQPNDAVWYNWYTTPEGILQKYNPDDHDYILKDRHKYLLEKGRWGRWGTRVDGRRTMIVDFMTDNDITGGNSGSPVLNAKGELIGLAFDGNLESLASDASYTEGYNKCINTDIRYVMWVLDKYAGMKHIVKEVTFSR